MYVLFVTNPAVAAKSNKPLLFIKSCTIVKKLRNTSCHTCNFVAWQNSRCDIGLTLSSQQ